MDAMELTSKSQSMKAMLNGFNVTNAVTGQQKTRKMTMDDMEYARKIMADIQANNSYDVSFACLQGEHEKCNWICSCKCHFRNKAKS